MALNPNSLLEDHPSGVGDLNSIINGNWRTLNNYVNPAAGLTATLDDGTPPGAGNVVIASGDVFTSDDVGAVIFFESDRESYVILSYVSPTQVTIIGSGELASQSFQLYRTTETARTAYVRGLTKRVRIVGGDDDKILQWNHSLLRFDFVYPPGYNIAAGRLLFGGGTSSDLTSSADLTFDDSSDILTVAGRVTARGYQWTHDTIASAGSITIDFALHQLRSINTLAADVTFATSNLAAGRQQILRIVCDGTPRNFTFPGSWVWLGTAPASIAANKTGILTLTAYGSSDSSVVAKWEVEP